MVNIKITVSGKAGIGAHCLKAGTNIGNAGQHRVDIDAYINRTNGFGPVHDTDKKDAYQSPVRWRTTGDEWCYEYKFAREGILVSPQLTEAES